MVRDTFSARRAYKEATPVVLEKYIVGETHHVTAIGFEAGRAVNDDRVRCAGPERPHGVDAE